jgi:hypothetical protein
MARLEDYRFGRVVVDGREETRDVIVLPDRVIRNWWRNDGHALVLDDLDDVLDDLPERLVVGTGAAGQMEPDPQAVRALRDRGVEVEVLRTDEAVRRYAASDPARTAAVVAPPCSEPSHARLRREPLVSSTGLAPLGPAGRLQPPPPPGPAELQHEADRTDRVVRKAVLGERHPHRIRVLEPGGTSPNRRGQRTGILEPDELDGGPNGGARQIRVAG